MNSQEISQHSSETNITIKENGIPATQITGVVGILYVVSILSQNAVFIISGAPDYRDPLSVVVTYHAQNADAMSIATGLEGINLILLLLFLTNLHGIVQNRGGAGTHSSRFAMVAGAVLSVLFAMMIITHITTVIVADGLTEPNPQFALIWRLHAAIFALALPALGATFISAALATHASGLTQSWQRLFAIGGGSALILAGLGNLAIANGSPLVYVGVLGLAMWLVWVFATSFRLIFKLKFL